MPEQQPDTVTALAEHIGPWVLDPFVATVVARQVLAWVEERYVPRADYAELEIELEGSVWRQGKMEEVIEAVRADREALRQAVLDLAASWVRPALYHRRAGHFTATSAATELRALAGGAS